MNLKKILTSVCMASVLGASVMPSVGYAVEPHMVADSQANSLLSSILGQEVSAVVLKTADLAEFVKRNASMGMLGAIMSQMNLEAALGASFDAFGFGEMVDTYYDLKDNYDDLKDEYNELKDEYDAAKGEYDKLKNTADDSKNKAESVKQVQNADEKAPKKQNSTKMVGNVSVPKELQGMGFENAMKDSKQMSSLITSELLPPVQDDEKEPLTDSQKVERQKKRVALKNAAVADAYALAVATQHEGTAIKENTIDSAKNRIAAADTMQEKTAAALDIGLIRLTQLIRSNEIAAMNLRLLAAEAIGDLPRDYSF